jgi:hypothetical protein
VEDRISEIRGILEGFDLEIITHAYITRGVRVSPGVRSDMVSRPIPIAVKLGRMGNHEYLKMLRQAPESPSPPMKSDSTAVDKERVSSAFNQVSGRPNLDHLIATACEQSLGRVLIHGTITVQMSDIFRGSSELADWRVYL